MRKNSSVLVTKASGLVVPFSEGKLRQSLQRAGAGESVTENILEETRRKLFPGISTKKIYRIAFDLLKAQSGHLAARYNLKRAIMELGPSGYPFERFVAALLTHQAYTVKVGETVKGKCVTHEIDVIAEKDHHHFMVECKYHNQPGTVSDVKIPLYIWARFQDLEAAWLKMPGHEAKFHQGWVVTNTRFTADAIQYGNCAGLKLIGWDYPDGGSLRSQIDMLGLYPITCLTTLTKNEKQQLLEKGIVLCKEICNHEQHLTSIGIKPLRARQILQEGQQLCHKLIPGEKH